ncbi:hypothetical protein SDJN02_18497, partial [Cucurbita argyrosperma subsp. argyrosperma]
MAGSVCMHLSRCDFLKQSSFICGHWLNEDGAAKKEANNGALEHASLIARKLQLFDNQPLSSSRFQLPDLNLTFFHGLLQAEVNQASSYQYNP